MYENAKLIQKIVKITMKQQEWLKQNKVNFSQLVHTALQKEMIKKRDTNDPRKIF